MSSIFILCFTAFLAGLIDSIVGGGGLINIPTLFTLYPNTIPATLFGTNKVGSVFGTLSAAYNFSRTVKVRWNIAIPAVFSSFIFSFLGAFLVTKISPQVLRQLLPFILSLVAVYTFIKKEFGQINQPIYKGIQEFLLALFFGALIGFYDGFFGPGTGSFLIFIFVQFFGLNFLNSSIISKYVNVSTNFAAILLFNINGNIIWGIGLTMAFFSVCGSLIGSRIALKYGSEFIRKFFLFIVVILIIKTFYDAFLK